MKQRISQRMKIFLSLSILLMSCNKQNAFAKSTPVFLASTNTPLVASIPEQVSLSGSVYIVSPLGPGVKPFAWGVELRREDGYKIIGEIDQETFPEFKFTNIKPGTYELWILLPYFTLDISNCPDIGLPDNSWKLSRELGNNQTMFIENIGYREAFIQSLKEIKANLADPNSDDFYAVLEGLEIKSEINNIDVKLICKSI